jgi:hypothetical protein
MLMPFCDAKGSEFFSYGKIFFGKNFSLRLCGLAFFAFSVSGLLRSSQ